MPGRKVHGYVKAMRRYRALSAKLDAKRALLDPLETRVDRACADAAARYGALTGGQIAEANRMLAAPPAAPGPPPAVPVVVTTKQVKEGKKDYDEGGEA
jgi:hypothetical protein